MVQLVVQKTPGWISYTDIETKQIDNYKYNIMDWNMRYNIIYFLCLGAVPYIVFN